MKTSRIFVGLLIAIIGIVLLLNNYGILNWSIWLTLGRLWPILLIIVGVLVFFDKSLLPLGVILALLALGFGFVVPYRAGNMHEKSGIDKYSWQLEPNITSATLNMNYGAGVLNIKENSNNLVEFDLNYAGVKPEVKYEIQGDKAEYHIKPGNRHYISGINKGVSMDWNLLLSPEVIWDMDLDMGAARADLDLSQIKLRTLKVDSGAGDIIIYLGNHGLETKVDIKAGASKIKIIVPEDVKLRVDLDGALTNSNLDTVGLVSSGEFYVTPDTIKSDGNILLDLDVGVSNFELVRIKSN